MFDKLVNATVGVATLPLDVAADVVTLGGAITDKDEPYTTKKIKTVMENIDRAVDPDED